MKSLFKNVAKFALAVGLIIAAFVVISPEAAKATTVVPEYSFNGSGKSSVTITDEQCSTITYDYNWIKFKPKATGYITITAKNASALSNYTAGYITFCDSSKKALGQSNEIYRTDYDKSYNYTMTYGVKKGKTYYFRVESAAGVKFDADAKAQKKNAGTKKSKAKTIKKNKTVKGVIIAGDKTVDWYKIKLTKSQKIKLSYTAKSNGDDDYNGIKVTFCDGKGKNFTYDSYDHVNRVFPQNYMKLCLKNSRTGKEFGLKPGTYYVKVERYNATSSGYYTLKWK